MRISDVEVGASLPEAQFRLTRADLVRYAGASGDFNPIHWNESVARAVGLPDVIAHGMFTMATAVQLVTAWCDDPGAVVAYGVRFTKPVVVPNDADGALLSVSGTVSAVDVEAGTATVTLTARSAGPDGEPVGVLGRAVATVRLAS